MGKLLTRGFHILFVKRSLYSMKIKEQTRKLAAGCSKQCFEVVDRTDEVSSRHCFEVADRTDDVSSRHCFEVADRTDEVSLKHCFEVADRTDDVSNHTYDKVKLTWFEEIFEEYHTKKPCSSR
ncbi:chlorohydrolase [Streptococcus pneumoniae]|nr:chlorohydrolase [Streptococcus pneumoniae]